MTKLQNSKVVMGTQTFMLVPFETHSSMGGSLSLIPVVDPCGHLAPVNDCPCLDCLEGNGKCVTGMGGVVMHWHLFDGDAVTFFLGVVEVQGI